MDWPISPAGQQAAAAAAAGDAAAAARQLGTLTVVDGLGVFARVAAVGGRPAVKGLAAAYWQAAPPAGGVLTRGAFVTRVAEYGFVPGEDALGIEPLDYQFTRQFILRVRDDPTLVAALGWPPDPRGVASTRPFYPEAVRGVSVWRQRICTVAAAHRDKGPISPQQWALFSLGSLYGMAGARSATRPGSAAAASILFARGVLHAAGCNVIRPGITPIGSAEGLFASLPREVFGYLPAATMDAGQRPEMGDIFHIRGADFEDPEGKPGADSTQVGVILGVWGNIWLTIEGGGPGDVTRQRTRELVPVHSPHGKWAFKYDDAYSKVGYRPLQGWFSVARFRPDLWMNPRPGTL